MEDIEKIKVLLKHFLEHTEEHAKEFEDLAKKIREAKDETLAQAIEKASLKLKEAIEILKPLI
ncbi:MAG: hypothetical protein ACK4GE_04110 [Caldimicrobium sp.]